MLAMVVGEVGEGGGGSYQFLHPCDCAVGMSQGVRQAVHTIASLAVAIETDSYASAESGQKNGWGGGGEKERNERERERGGGG